MKHKFVEWGKRYIPAEILAIIGAMTGGLLMHLLFKNEIITALGGTWGDNIAYYGKILYEEIKLKKAQHKAVTVKGLVQVLRNVILEFGPSEYADALLFRPLAMYFFPKLLQSVPLGLIVGKFAADITFYIPTIISYELRKKYIKD